VRKTSFPLADSLPHRANSIAPYREYWSTEVIFMQTALRMETTALPGHRLEISAPELPEGIDRRRT
jgi:hypothetical protein